MEALDRPATPPATTRKAPSHRKPRKSRGRGLRTTTGCAVCRKRHMKCDEVRPICGHCLRSNRDCVYSQQPSGDDTRRRASDVSGVTSPAAIQRLPSRASISARSQAYRRSSRASQASLSVTPVTDNSLPIISRPESGYGTSIGHWTEAAPYLWFGALPDDADDDDDVDDDAAATATEGSLDPISLEKLSESRLAQRYGLRHGPTIDHCLSSQASSGMTEAMCLPGPALPASLSRLSTNSKGLDCWQTADVLHLTARERTIFHRYVTGVAAWIDLFDPYKHYSSLVPHLALRNEGLLKAVLALGARQLSIKPPNREDVNIYRTAAVQYYAETLQYLQSAMRFPSYAESPQILATSVVVSKYEMLDGAGREWKRHLEGVFWIQRSREIDGESGGLEQATWWAWLRQDIWAAFRERRRCFSFFRPRTSYQNMGLWEMASRVIYLLAQSVNYASDDEKEGEGVDPGSRIDRASELMQMLDNWRRSINVQFDTLPDRGPLDRAFQPLWIHPPALGASLQMYCMAKVLLLTNQPAASGYVDYYGRDKTINECIDIVGGIALRLPDDACRLVSTQCLFAVGLCCVDGAKRARVVELIQDHQDHTGWPSNTNLAEELRAKWAAHRTF